jgi:hypothetical protein
VKRECFSNEGLVWTIHPRYKQWISFHHMNLVESEFSTPWPDGALFDLILCRNVMIYFAPEVNRRLIGQFHNSLGDDGWLVVGASEHNLESYQAFRTSDAPMRGFIKNGHLPGCRWKWRRNRGRAGGRGRGPPAADSADPIPSQSPSRADLEGLRQLADRGDWQGAAEYGQTIAELVTD